MRGTGIEPVSFGFFLKALLETKDSTIKLTTLVKTIGKWVLKVIVFIMELPMAISTKHLAFGDFLPYFVN